MFKALKSSGFNLEDTHLKDPDRIAKLVSMVFIAFIWCYKVGIYLDACLKPITIKKHGYRAKSFQIWIRIYRQHITKASKSVRY